MTADRTGKEPDTLRIAYYPGCALKTTARDVDRSAIAVAGVLGVEMVEVPRWNCCGTVFSLTDDDLIHHLAPIRNLVRVQEMTANGSVTGGGRVVTICPMCFNTLKRANLRMKENPDNLKTINEFMSLEEDYAGEVEVIHFLEMVQDLGVDRIRAKVRKPLRGLRVAPYYGCMILRPREIAIDDPEDPRIQDDILAALGAEVVSHPYKKVCCGSYQTVRDKYVVAGLTHDILMHARQRGAEIVTTCCPLCAFNLDFRQREVRERHPEFDEMPILCISQLMALAFGLEEECYYSGLNYVDPRPLLESKHLLGTLESTTRV